MPDREQHCGDREIEAPADREGKLYPNPYLRWVMGVITNTRIEIKHLEGILCMACVEKENQEERKQGIR